jgi:putative tryptophan/tyrosine transport system substrate-binding protein
MRRRQFLTLIGGVATAWPLTALGQVTRTRPLIARLSYGSKDVPIIAEFIERFLSGMRELGYVEGRDFDMTYGWADFHPDQLPRVAAEVVKLAPDVILAAATIEAVPAAKATATIPIVVAVLADPVALGFTTSDARPTGNVTGIMPYVKGLPSKQLELARELVPGATRIGLIDDVIDPKAHPQRQEIEATARERSKSYLRRCVPPPISTRHTKRWPLPVSRQWWSSKAT